MQQLKQIVSYFEFMTLLEVLQRPCFVDQNQMDKWECDLTLQM